MADNNLNDHVGEMFDESPMRHRANSKVGGSPTKLPKQKTKGWKQAIKRNYGNTINQNALESKVRA